jgi:hypothetical protein
VKPRKNRSWVMHLPHGLREQPAWVFIGLLTAVTGLSYLFGLSQSSTVTRILQEGWVRGWGGFLFVSGTLVVISTIMSNKPLERLALRFLSLGFLVYLGWVLAVIPPTKAMVTVVACLSLVGLSEIRVAVLKVVLRPTNIKFHDGEPQ